MFSYSEKVLLHLFTWYKNRAKRTLEEIKRGIYPRKYIEDHIAHGKEYGGVISQTLNRLKTNGQVKKERKFWNLTTKSLNPKIVRCENEIRRCDQDIELFYEKARENNTFELGYGAKQQLESHNQEKYRLENKLERLKQSKYSQSGYETSINILNDWLQADLAIRDTEYKIAIADLICGLDTTVQLPLSNDLEDLETVYIERIAQLLSIHRLIERIKTNTDNYDAPGYITPQVCLGYINNGIAVQPTPVLYYNKAKLLQHLDDKRGAKRCIFQATRLDGF